jgi:hypothetical protein
MNLRNKLAAICILLPTLTAFVVGIVYLRAPEIMPYHKEVLGVDWLQLQPGVRTMLVAFINVYGAMHVAVSIALGTLVLVPLRRDQQWARWGILAVGLPAIGSAAYTAVRLAFTTGAHTPWRLALVLFAMLLVGVALAKPKQAV